MRVATLNVENLFSRVHTMNSDDPAKTTVVLAAVAELQRFDRATGLRRGDFNELPSSESLAPLLQRPGLRNTFEELPNDADRWTHRDDVVPSKNGQIDYLLVSEGLWSRLREVGI